VVYTINQSNDWTPRNYAPTAGNFFRIIGLRKEQ